MLLPTYCIDGLVQGPLKGGQRIVATYVRKHLYPTFACTYPTFTSTYPPNNDQAAKTGDSETKKAIDMTMYAVVGNKESAA